MSGRNFVTDRYNLLNVRSDVSKTRPYNPITILWILWYFYSVKAAMTPGSEIDHIVTYSVIGGGVIGGIIAAIIIMAIYKKAQKTNSELIESIESVEQ